MRPEARLVSTMFLAAFGIAACGSTTEPLESCNDGGHDGGAALDGGGGFGGEASDDPALVRAPSHVELPMGNDGGAGGQGGAIGGGDQGGAGEGGAGGGDGLTCFFYPDCNPNFADDCLCVGCTDVCDSTSDCICPSCIGNLQYCNPENTCPESDGQCDPYWESCGCPDCAEHPLCTG
ncbi:MAG: hypothetical protein HOW73_21215 [Polyangiaceae bacterium]|nr:hypothetical protein [Polyangiaceae bacterium]